MHDAGAAMKNLRRRTAAARGLFWWAALALAPACAVLPYETVVSYGRTQAPEKSLVVLFTHDLHSSFLPRGTRTFEGRTAERGGWAKIASLIGEERTSGAGRTLVVDGGDFSMGTLFHALFVREASELRLLGRMGYDVATLGNHEFDFHMAGLAGALRAAKARGGGLPELIASNVVFGSGVEAEDARSFHDYPVRDFLVLERGGLRIGLFGLMGRGGRPTIRRSCPRPSSPIRSPKPGASSKS